MLNEGQIAARLTRIEQLLEAIAKHVGLDTEEIANVVSGEDVSPQVLKYIRDGQLIQAIALYRKETGVGLREAKDVIDEVRRRMQSR